MGKEYKKVFKAYMAWDYQREIDELNEASRQGWQLVRGGLFSSRFKKNTELCYRYQIDYPGEVEDMGRYIETFREQGWEYISSTLNGWHYFRRLYDPAEAEERYEIFTDTASLMEMKKRWSRMAALLAIAVALMTAVEFVWFILQPKLPSLIIALSMAVLLGAFLRGIYLMRRREKRRNSGSGALFPVCLLICFLGLAASIFLIENRPSFKCSFSAAEYAPVSSEPEEAVDWNGFEVRYADNYFLSLELTADAPACFSIVDQNNETVYEAEGAEISEKNVRLRLPAGAYRMYISDFAGGAIDFSAELD